MKYLPSVLVSGLALSAAISVFAQDPVKLSPQYYKVLIDNDEVRVLEYRLKPGEKEPTHPHPRGIVYALSDAKFKITFPMVTLKRR